jgi:hypothetical protein
LSGFGKTNVTHIHKATFISYTTVKNELVTSYRLLLVHS